MQLTGEVITNRADGGVNGFSERSAHHAWSAAKTTGC
jgi:hypothetical protein